MEEEVGPRPRLPAGPLHFHTTLAPRVGGTTSKDPGTAHPARTAAQGLAPTIRTSRPSPGHTGSSSKFLAAGKLQNSSAGPGWLGGWVQMAWLGFRCPVLRTPGRLGMVAQACNPSTLGGRGWWITRSRDRDHPGQHGETPSLLNIQKISWVWWHVPVIPATQEAEAGELPEPRRRRLR